MKDVNVLSIHWVIPAAIFSMHTDVDKIQVHGYVCGQGGSTKDGGIFVDESFACTNFGGASDRRNY